MWRGRRTLPLLSPSSELR
ncbi:hypothetical protein E2C01_048970 [Portunus trituberculatus]|uniref:Uncharacterized protein n=1 Tax=Portunus trituberculatus TaxID=210409 RepID=A0A5B7GBL4_PORTR|nr:hypothetical protein [Portunus trituberculatus]